MLRATASERTANATFLPFYAAFHTEDVEHDAYYTIQREPRLLSAAQKLTGPRSSYVGSEVFLSLVDRREAPFSADLRQLGVAALCTNRDLPLQMPLGLGQDRLHARHRGAGGRHPRHRRAIEAVLGGTRGECRVEDDQPAVAQLSFAVRYASGRRASPCCGTCFSCTPATVTARLASRSTVCAPFTCKRTVRRFPLPGLITFGRGLEIELEVDELAFAGGSAFLFGAVMEQFFARYVSINSFAETVLRSSSRGEIMRWVPRCGQRPIV